MSCFFSGTQNYKAVGRVLREQQTRAAARCAWGVESHHATRNRVDRRGCSVYLRYLMNECW
jgi:hypothetical protein